MKSFKEFLQEKEALIRADEASLEEKKKRWIDSVVGLIENIKALDGLRGGEF